MLYSNQCCTRSERACGILRFPLAADPEPLAGRNGAFLEAAFQGFPLVAGAHRADLLRFLAEGIDAPTGLDHVARLFHCAKIGEAFRESECRRA
jgi:hypothetical protein